MANWSSIPCEEEDGTRQESWGPEGLSASVTLRCGWDVRHSLAADLIGNRRLYLNAPGLGGPFATTAAIVPGDSNSAAVGQEMFYETALVTVGYDNRQPEDAFSESLEPTAEFITLNKESFEWSGGDALKDGEAPGRLIRGLNYVQTRFEVAPPLPSALLTLIGSVNNGPISSTLLGLTFATETLMYIPPTINRTIKTDGSGTYTITTKFSYKPETWNKFWRAENQAYETINVAGGGAYKNYPLGDFSGIIT